MEIDPKSLAEDPAKAQYIQDEIIAKNFSVNDFNDFLSLKAKEKDMSNVSQEELESLVLEFQSNNTETRNPKRTSGKLEMEVLENIPLDLERREGQEGIFYIPCLVPPATEISEMRNLEITVCDPIYMKGGLLTTDYVVYDVVTSPLDWRVKRRYSDFSWLREILVAAHPGKFIPPIPPKITSSKRLEWDNVLQRQQFLNRFCNVLVQDKLIRSSEYVLAFLSKENTEEFQEFKSQTKKTKRPDSLNHLKSLSGSIKCDPTDKSNSYQNSLEYLVSSESYAKKLKKEANVLASKVNEMCESLLRYSELLQEQASIQSMVTGRNADSEIYSVYSSVFLDWSNAEFTRILKIKEYFIMSNRYHAKQCETLKNMVKEIESHRKQEIKDEGKGRVISNFYSMFNASCEDEIEKMCAENTKVIYSQIAEFLKQEIENANSYLINCRSSTEKLERINDLYKLITQV